jgi:hypothetical protein
MKRIKINESQRIRLFEAYNSDLYHFTNLDGIYGILKSNSLNMITTDDEEAVCLSRTSNPYIGYMPNTRYGLIFRITLDTNKLMSSSRGMSIKPWSQNNPRTVKIYDKFYSVSDYEERAYRDISPLNKYCKRIDVFPEVKNSSLDKEQMVIIQKLLDEFPSWRKYFNR